MTFPLCGARGHRPLWHAVEEGASENQRSSESAAPYRNVRKGPDGQSAGLQIDLLMQTACTAYVIEIKRRRYIGPEVEEEVRQKIKRLPLRKGLSVRPALVYDGELAPSVEGRGFFDAIIPASRLLRP